MIQGAIFDVDGTLLDTMPMWRTVAAKYLNQLGVEVDQSLGTQLFEMTLPESAQLLHEKYALPYSVNEIMQGIHRVADNAYRQEALLKTGAKEFLEVLVQEGIPMSVVSSGSEALIFPAFERLGILDYFTKIFASTETGIHKREPTMFLQAAAVMGTQPAQTWVFEDAVYAVRVAKKAGFRTIGIADEASRNERDVLARETEGFWEEYPNFLPELFR